MEDQNKNQNPENTQQQNKQVVNQPKKSNSGLIFLLFLLLILLGVVTWLYINQRQTTEEIQTVLTVSVAAP